MELDTTTWGNPLPQSGSSRKYFRLPGKGIGCIGTCRAENQAFISLATAFHKAGLPVPEIHQVSSDGMAYTQEDVGLKSLYDLLQSPEAPYLLEETMKMLANFHTAGHRVADYKVCYPVAEMNHSSVSWDLNYFKYCFLKRFLSENLDEVALERDFNTLTERLLSVPREVFMVRDFQSRNVMVSEEGKLTLIDFQGGRRGPREYDLASFLWQARAGFSPEKRQELLNVYLAEAEKLGFSGRQELKESLPYFVLFRILQTLGAYGFRGQTQGKELFTGSIPTALLNLKELIREQGFAELPYLVKLFGPKPLTVTVTSFSYKKGYPEDQSGNGGGFVFDCRGCHNPGRLDRFKPLTGNDKEVIDFIESNGDVPQLVITAFLAVSPTIDTYVRRGFESLQVSFGCTGGRHRSVYAASEFSKLIKEKYPDIIVRTQHREQPQLT